MQHIIRLGLFNAADGHKYPQNAAATDEFIIDGDRVIHRPTGAWFLARPGCSNMAYRCWGRTGDLRRQFEIEEAAAKLLRARLCPAERVAETFRQWKNFQVPDDTAFYHTALDIRYRHGGLAEKMALVHLRYQRSTFRNVTDVPEP